MLREREKIKNICSKGYFEWMKVSKEQRSKEHMETTVSLGGEQFGFLADKTLCLGNVLFYVFRNHSILSEAL